MSIETQPSALTKDHSKNKKGRQYFYIHYFFIHDMERTITCILSFCTERPTCPRIIGFTTGNTQTTMRWKILHLMLAGNGISMPPDVMTFRVSYFTISLDSGGPYSFALGKQSLHCLCGVCAGNCIFKTVDFRSLVRMCLVKDGTVTEWHIDHSSQLSRYQKQTLL